MTCRNLQTSPSVTQKLEEWYHQGLRRMWVENIFRFWGGAFCLVWFGFEPNLAKLRASLLPVLCLGISLENTQHDQFLWGDGVWTKVSHVPSKHPTYYTIALEENFYTQLVGTKISISILEIKVVSFGYSACPAILLKKFIRRDVTENFY